MAACSFGAAVQRFEKVLELVGDNALENWEPTLFNLGHAYRKLR